MGIGHSARAGPGGAISRGRAAPAPQRATERPKTAHPITRRTLLLASGSAALFAALLTVVIWLR
ncbi:hypothetical protein ATY41_06170 [Leifsonia xyli subsp. xyli]|uniref:Uncharacterized protein n=1 Tax=Leifsonia xyli subsp. xyli TaxID=59736 RepID=A0A1E2SI01_LEIXY|nr:hypothetical protein ATY41_06170 [Leifsonia xyli subsp. xyli]